MRFPVFFFSLFAHEAPLPYSGLLSFKPHLRFAGLLAAVVLTAELPILHLLQTYVAAFQRASLFLHCFRRRHSCCRAECAFFPLSVVRRRPQTAAAHRHSPESGFETELLVSKSDAFCQPRYEKSSVLLFIDYGTWRSGRTGWWALLFSLNFLPSRTSSCPAFVRVANSLFFPLRRRLRVAKFVLYSTLSVVDVSLALSNERVPLNSGLFSTELLLTPFTPPLRAPLFSPFSAFSHQHKALLTTVLYTVPALVLGLCTQTRTVSPPRGDSYWKT